jgi:hypothetical protein
VRAGTCFRAPGGRAILARMAPYTIVTTGAADGDQHVTTVHFPDDAAVAVAVAAAAGAVLTPEHSSIAMARGVGGELAFVGSWDLAAGGARQCTAED